MNPVVRRVLSVGLLAYGVYGLRHQGEGTLLDGVDLAIHETGHLVFAPFGEFIGFAGGTLFQLLMPAFFLIYFLRQRDQYAASVALWWIGQNCGHIAVYVADARAQELPLVGGGEHDWDYLLGRMGLLAQDQHIARAITSVGYLLVVGAALWGLLVAARSTDVEEGGPVIAA
ncbi:hypothetical protein BH11GEM2_BH11GEM2_21100 [soil metagenome]